MEEEFLVCRNCMKNVPSSHFILHEAHCLRFLAPQRKEPVLGAKTQEHCEQRDSQEDCSAASEPLKKLLISFPSRPGGNQTPTEEKAVRPKTKDINRSPLLFESSTNQAPRDTDRPMNLPSESELGSGAASPAENEPPYDILKRCLQCGILLPLPILNQHEVKCRQLAFSRESR
uniref:XIAP-associated factor 1 C-terminal domain-containing protein n=1 Tax=Cavia porcellus TaxID=10141 RepID=A0A286XMZ9_CAVPO